MNVQINLFDGFGGHREFRREAQIRVSEACLSLLLASLQSDRDHLQQSRKSHRLRIGFGAPIGCPFENGSDDVMIYTDSTMFR